MALNTTQFDLTLLLFTLIYYKLTLQSLIQQTTMTETNNPQSTDQPSPKTASTATQEAPVILKSTAQEHQPTPLFRHYEKNLVLFAYNREIDEDPPQEIMVLQQPKKHYNKITEEDRVAEMFGNFNIDGTTEKLFLTKIDPLEHKEIAKEIKQMLEVADSLSRKDRFERRKQMFESIRPHMITQQLASEEVLAKRTIRVVKMESLNHGGSIKGVVELGGKSVEYQDFNIMSQNQDYYALVRRKVRADEVFPQVSIEENILTGIDFEDQGMDQEKINQNEDDYDSNDSENSAFDYPEEEESDRSSQGIIRDYDEEEDYEGGNEEDDEELYMKYLRRERRRERHMEEEFDVAYQEYD